MANLTTHLRQCIVSPMLAGLLAHMKPQTKSNMPANVSAALCFAHKGRFWKNIERSSYRTSSCYCL